MLLGRRVVLEHNPTRVGRGADNHVVLDGESVSRRHARFEQRSNAWLVVDDGSTNGVLCNDVQISREVVLKNGDRVKIGPTIFKFLSGADVEASYHEEIYRMTIMDGLTQSHNKPYFCEALERELIRGRRHERDLSILLFDIDHFKRINDVHGHLAGDFVLKELARVVQARIRHDMVFARYGGEEFAIILPETSLEGAAALGETLRQQISEHLFIFKADTIRVTISVGAALLQSSDQGAHDLIKRADDALYIAKREGSNRVATDSTPTVPAGAESMPRIEYRRVLDGPSLLAKVLSQKLPATLVAFEIGEEAAIVEHLGSKIYEAWFRQLIRDVEISTDKTETLASWGDRYVVTALQDSPTEAVNAVIARVRDAWTQRPVAESYRAVPRQLRSAVLTAAEFTAHRERAIDVLVGRLLQGAATATPEDGLPFPVAALKAMVASRRTALGRVKALLDSIETALRFIVAVEFSVLREASDTGLGEKTAELLWKFARRGGPWESSALQLAPLIPDDQESAVVTMARGLSSTKRHEPLATALKHVAELRHAIVRQTGLSEDAYGGEEDGLRDLLDGILAALRPLSKLRLVSVAEIENIDDDEVIRYALYLHSGPGEHFPIIRESLPFRLQKHWCYLLPADSARAPLSLAPLVLSRTCETCGRIEVAIAERPTFGPKGAMVNARGVTSNHEGSIELPWQKPMQAFYAAILAASQRASVPESEPPSPPDSDREEMTIRKPIINLRNSSSVPPSKLAPTGNAVKILFLGANPSDGTRRMLDKEAREIKQRLQSAKHGGKFDFAQEWAVRVDDLQASLLRHEPVVIHFSGQGSSAGQILVEDEEGKAFSIEGDALGNLFRILRQNIRCVVLNACYSISQADEIARHIDCVIGMTAALDNATAIAFAGAFYQGLGFGKSVQVAFDLGCNQIDLILRLIAPIDRPRLVSRAGVDPKELYLVNAKEGQPQPP